MKHISPLVGEISAFRSRRKVLLPAPEGPIIPVIPFTIATGDEKYPELEKIFTELQIYGELYKIDAVKIAREAGAEITKNVVMLGALAGTNILPFKPDFLLDVILESVPKKYKEINKKAFELGFKSIKK